MNKQKIFNVLSIMGILFIISCAIGYAYHVDNKGAAFDPPPIEIPNLVAKQFSRVITKNRIESMPDAKFYDKNGDALSWHDYKGKYLLVNFWASWCSPCVVELPSLNELQNALPEDKIEVIAISIDRNKTPENLGEFLKNRNIGEFAAYMDTNREIENNITMRGIPTTYLLGPEGEIRYIFEGDANWNTPTFKEFFNLLLAQL